MKRRALLGTIATTAGLAAAGCLGSADTSANGEPTDTGTPTDERNGTGTRSPTDDGDGTGTRSPTDDGDGTGTRSPTDDGTPTPKPSDTPTRTPPDGVVVENIVVRKATAYESTMGSGGVLAGRDRQYVVATVRASGELSADAFAFETEGHSWAPGLPDTSGAVNWSVAGHHGGAVGGHALDGAQSYLAFTVPSPLSASNPRIRLTDEGSTASAGDTTWPLDADARERLAASAPAFELREFDAPDTVDHGDSLSVSLTAENVSETDGRFLAAVYWPTDMIADDDESHLIEREVAAGERVSASLSLSTEYAAFESGPHPLSVDGHVSGEQTVRVRNVPTES